MEILTKSNFKLYCAKHYVTNNDSTASIEDLERDLKNVTYIKRLISEYSHKRETKDRLLLNCIITLSNVFGPENATRILFFKIPDKHWLVLKTFLIYLSLMPDVVTGLKKNIVSSEIGIDNKLYNRLLSL